MKISIAFHLVGLVMWLGSLMILTRCLKIFSRAYPAEASEALDTFRNTLKRVFYGFCIPGLLISLVTGVYQIVQMGMAYYMKQGWFHAKLTLVLLLFVVTLLLAKEMRRIAGRELVPAKRAIVLHAASGASLFAIVFLTILYR